MDENEECESFKRWLQDVSECLQGFRKADPDKMQEAAAEEARGSETDGERCMRVVRSVLDEETALDMVKTYLAFTREDEDIPEDVQIDFKDCEFDPDEG